MYTSAFGVFLHAGKREGHPVEHRSALRHDLPEVEHHTIRAFDVQVVAVLHVMRSIANQPFFI